MDQQPDGGFQISIAPRSERYDPDDDRWRAQVGDMAIGLQQEVGGVRRRVQAAGGAKGGPETLVIALGSAGAFTAAVQFLRAWLGRDRTRSLEVSWTVGDEERRISVKGEAIDDEAIATLAAAAASCIGGTEWTPGTTPS